MTSPMFEAEVKCPACRGGHRARCTYWIDGRSDRVCESWKHQDLGQLGLTRQGDRRGRRLEME